MSTKCNRPDAHTIRRSRSRPDRDPRRDRGRPHGARRGSPSATPPPPRRRPCWSPSRDGEIRAAVAVESGRAIADPFRPTADLVALLRARAAQIRRRRRRRPLRLRRPDAAAQLAAPRRGASAAEPLSGPAAARRSVERLASDRLAARGRASSRRRTGVV